MEQEQRKKSTKEDIKENEKRHYECLLKFEKIVDQFDDLADAIDPVAQHVKRRKTSRRVKKKVGEGNSSVVADEAIHNTQVAEKVNALEQIITQHINDLQSDQPPESTF